MYGLKSKLHSTMTRASKMATSIDHITLTQTITAFLHSVEQRVDDYLRSAHQLIYVLYAAREGKLHPSLLTAQQLEPIFRHIQDYSHGCEIKINALGLIRILLSCELRINLVTLTGLEPISRTSLIVYEPNTHLDLNKLSTNFHDNSSVRLPLPTSLSTRQDHSNLIHGSFTGIGLLALLFLVYACHIKILIVASTCWTCCHRKKSPTSEELDSVTTLTISGISETSASSQDDLHLRQMTIRKPQGPFIQSLRRCQNLESAFLK